MLNYKTKESSLRADEIKEQIETLNKKKNAIDSKIAVATSKKGQLEEELKELEPSVLEMVGSLEPDEVQEYMENLESEIETKLDKLNSIK